MSVPTSRPLPATRDCKFPYATYDQGLLACVVIGGSFLFIAFCLLLVILFLAWRKKSRSTYDRADTEFYEEMNKKGGNHVVKILSVLLGFLLIIGLAMLVVGGYYLYYARIYGVSYNCNSLIVLTAARPLPSNVTTTPVNLTIAFVGDTGLSSDALAIYALVKNNAEFMVHLGDFDYCDDPGLFHEQIDYALGEQFPMVGVIGNHDIPKWSDYEQVLNTHYNGHGAGINPGLVCEGKIGVNYWCMYKGVFFAFSSVGTLCGGGYTKYQYHVDELTRNLQIAADLGVRKPWRVCAWHKNQRMYQVGTKKDEVGYGVYDVCKQAGALVMTGHEHSFSRTQAMQVMETQQVAQSCADLSCVYNLTNATVVSVSGLGGKNRRAPDATLAGLPHWATSYADQYGSLFCKFNFNGNADLAYCYFLDVNGAMHDEFFVSRV